VRLLVTHREKDGIVHATFRDLPAFLRPADLLVVNDSATLPAALPAQLPDGTTVPLHLSTRLPAELWVVEPRTPHVADGATLRLPGGATARLLARYSGSNRLWVAHLTLDEPFLDYVHRWGRPITYSYVSEPWPLSAYQTMFATKPGSAEMPSAGRPFTPRVVERLRRRGVRLATITLHTGVASLEGDEQPYAEYHEVPAATASEVNAARRNGGRVIAVGTTVVRALESAADGSGATGAVGTLSAVREWTDLVVTPERGVRVVDGLLTGFHEPKASHLQMLAAIAGMAHLRRAYRAALQERYLWHEFGDVHLIL
jgi:S-adenosylmethionine:tRNA ribosyltransferase-isomerase